MIPRRNTETPLPVQTLLVNLDRLVNSVPRDDLVTVIDELGAAFNGTGPDLQRLIDKGNALTEEATEALPETVRLIDDGQTVLDTQRDSGPAIKSFAADLALLSATLRDRDADLRGHLRQRDRRGPASCERLLRENRPAIATLLGNLLSGAQVTVARIDGLEQILATYPAVVTGGYTVVPGDGTAHFGLVEQTQPQGVPVRQPPAQPERHVQHPGQDPQRPLHRTRRPARRSAGRRTPPVHGRDPPTGRRRILGATTQPLARSSAPTAGRC